jgi:hypothetical protein
MPAAVATMASAGDDEADRDDVIPERAETRCPVPRPPPLPALGPVRNRGHVCTRTGGSHDDVVL